MVKTEGEEIGWIGQKTTTHKKNKATHHDFFVINESHRNLLF
jgi:hypothetical protein